VLEVSQRRVFSRELGLVVITITLSVALAAVSIVYLIQTNDFNSTLNLEKNERIVSLALVEQTAGNYSVVVAPRAFQYSGYLMVYGTSSTDNAWVKLEYWFDGKLYSFTQTLGTQGQLFFAIPKTNSAAVYTGNLNPKDEAAITLTIIYNY
jgi:hypothetical protein